MELFAKASKAKFRFQTSKGNLSTEHLWDLSLESLDTIAKSINKEIKASEEESFIEEKSSKDTELSDRLEVVKYIIAYKIKQRDANAKRIETLGRKAHLEAIIAEKQSESLRSKSVEELQKELEALGN